MAGIMDFSLLRKYHIPVVPYKIASSQSQATIFSGQIGYPIALKLISDKTPHKSEYHALSLNLKDANSVMREFERLKKIDKKAKILVQKFIPHPIELIIGGKTDPQFGPTILLGMGGIYTEILEDVQMRICPPSDSQIRSMVSQLKAFPILKGARAQKGINLLELCTILRKLSNLMEREQPAELDINPLISTSKGLMAADVRVVKK
ncbi:MAG: acetate--CoA ligase family protein [Candidatus Micrarchaeota archaeon]